MRPRVATILTARPWEADLVETARVSALIRVVARAYSPEDIDHRDLDVVVAGAETAWVSPAQIRIWRRLGCRVMGVYPKGDRPAQALLTRGGVDGIAPDTTTTVGLLRQLRALTMDPIPCSRVGRVIGVAGPHGSPGRTEVALALSKELRRLDPVTLIDLDADGPSLSLRLGLSPEPSLLDVGSCVRESGEIPADMVRTVSGISVITGAFGRRIFPLQLARDVILAAAESTPWVVVDLGPHLPGPINLPVNDVIAVCDASPTGLVRAAEMIMQWSGPPPFLALNRVGTPRRDVVVAARRATGLDPVVTIPYQPEVRMVGVSAQGPTDRFGSSLRPLINLLAGTPTQRSL